MSDELFALLEKLASRIVHVIEEDSSKGSIQSVEEVYQFWRVDGFQYTDKGVKVNGGGSEERKRKRWTIASTKLYEMINHSDEYKSVLTYLSQAFTKNDNIPSYLTTFIAYIIDLYLEHADPERTQGEIERCISNFIHELKGEAIEYNVTAELDGVILQAESIEISDRILLRQTRIKDLEKELHEVPFGHPTFRKPSAILSFMVLADKFTDAQIESIQFIQRSNALLRLFKVGSVANIGSKIKSESVLGIKGVGSSPIYPQHILEQYLVSIEDVPKLKRFWKIMSEAMPKSFFDDRASKIDYLTIAYNRYCDALFQQVIIEGRFANAMMGIEALFLKPVEKDEVGYRLRMRVSKVLGLFGFDYQEVIRMIKDGYGIRSGFVHGGQLSYKDKKELEMKYKKLNSVLHSLLEYLRVAIIFMILVHKDKEEGFWSVNG